MQAFVVLAEERNVTSAAERLRVSQPAMSATLRRLREIFDDPLFLRSAKGLVLTETAETLLERIIRVLGLIEELEQETKTFSPLTDKLELKIAASEFTHSSILPALMSGLKEDAPNTILNISPLVLDGLAQSLENGSIDLAVVPDFLAPANAQIRKLFEVELVYLLRRGHELLDETVTLKSLSECEHVRVAPTSVYRSNRIGKIFRSAGFDRHVKLTVASYNSAIEVIRSTDLVALVPKTVAEQLGNEFATCEPPFHLEPISMCLIWHPKKQNSKSHKWVREYLAKRVKQDNK